MEWLRQNQLDIMLILSGICATVTFCGLFTHATKYKKIALFLMGLSATVMLIADRFAYIYRGNETLTGYWMVRICNFLVFFLTVVIVHTFNIYLIDLVKNELKLDKMPIRLRFAEISAGIGYVLVIASQFTGLYYTFDETNHYQRSGGFFIGYIIPLLIILLQFSVILQNRKLIPQLLLNSLILFSLLPLVASVVQFFFYGISFTNMMLVGLVAMVRICEIINANITLELARKHEYEIMQQEKESMRMMFEETAYALAEAIDAKDNYTHGHSKRVALYSEMIASRLGWSKEKCRNIYFIALLHDVGKIGVPEEIINKDGSLTDKEYEIIKEHPVLGENILTQISQYPDLSIGAHYHHERYDGKGYPDGLQKEDIPEFARIIAVADAYDAMTSNRSYRTILPQDVVRSEIEKGRGMQFDPMFANIMIDLIDSDAAYCMHE